MSCRGWGCFANEHWGFYNGTVLGIARITRRDGGLYHGRTRPSLPLSPLLCIRDSSEMYPSVSERSAIQYLSIVIPDSAFGMLRSGGPRPNSALRC